MDVHDLDWGDVVVDTGDVMLCQATWREEPVLVKRWRDGALDSELACRRALRDAGVPSLELLGWGDGWMVVEDQGATPWQLATDADLANPEVAGRLGTWFARVHGIAAGDWFGDAPVLDRAHLLTGSLLDSLAASLPEAMAAALPRAIAVWRNQLDAVPPVVLVGSLSAEGTVVMGAGLDAMVTDLSLAHAGAPVSDLVMAQQALPAGSFERFLAAYEAVAGPVDAQAFEARLGIDRAVDLLLEELRDGRSSPEALGRLSVMLGLGRDGHRVTD